MSEATPTRRSTDGQQSRLVTWLKVNVLTSILVLIAIGGVGWTAVSSVSAWVHAIEDSAKEGVKAAADITRLQANVVDIDHRLNDQYTRITDLHTLSDQADADLKSRGAAGLAELKSQLALGLAELKAQLDTNTALARLNTERSFQPTLPTPRSPR